MRRQDMRDGGGEDAEKRARIAKVSIETGGGPTDGSERPPQPMARARVATMEVSNGGSQQKDRNLHKRKQSTATERTGGRCNGRGPWTFGSEREVGGWVCGEQPAALDLAAKEYERATDGLSWREPQRNAPGRRTGYWWTTAAAGRTVGAWSAAGKVPLGPMVLSPYGDSCRVPPRLAGAKKSTTTSPPQMPHQATGLEPSPAAHHEPRALQASLAGRRGQSPHSFIVTGDMGALIGFSQHSGMRRCEGKWQQDDILGRSASLLHSVQTMDLRHFSSRFKSQVASLSPDSPVLIRISRPRL
ncbi:hypothetical protein G7046_g9702 [Stylonectria norvegica]|nr:hypothetical protein G7046_g9702 [Stylonectria norvegica]